MLYGFQPSCPPVSNYLCHYAIGKARIVAKERGYNWDTMTEEEKEEFIDNIVHEPS
ncbi:hypothetical protein [Microcystis sp. M169S2]|uniref:hypothetical protein n=1 Tax=Microcystis sp. M169S2 TaxID=2771157 RepID=UPI001788D09F|nr:hypothetical protein [Microcystis sp. M169S2]MCA2717670.1 hypothetical protein [Microcystis sp. M169S2]